MSRMEKFLKSGKYLKAADLDGSPHPVTVESVRWESLQDDKDEQPILSFVGKSKEMPLNKTNSLTLVEAFGEDETKWPGRQITLFPTRTTFGGSLVDCIRIRIDGAMQSADLPAQEKSAKGAAPSGPPEDEIPFFPNVI